MTLVHIFAIIERHSNSLAKAYAGGHYVKHPEDPSYIQSSWNDNSYHVFHLGWLNFGQRCFRHAFGKIREVYLYYAVLILTSLIYHDFKTTPM